VSPSDGAVVMGFGRIGGLREPTEAEILAMAPKAQTLAKGEKGHMGDSIGTGVWCFVVANPDGKKAVRTKIKFHAR
jgi:hypothetical protein